jgi:CheY-like chemotaxis protein
MGAAQKSAPPAEDLDVLVIDDSEIARASVIRVLSDAGMSVAGLASPVGATRAILQRSVRLVLVDWDMPSMTGDKLVGILRQNKRLNYLKVVLMSGHDPIQLRNVAADVGANASIAKADGPDHMVRLIQDLLGRAT